METSAASSEADFLEIQVDEDMNDLDDDNTEATQSTKVEPMQQSATEEPEGKEKPIDISDNADDLELDSETELDDTETVEDAEEHEKELMNMPPLQSVMSDMSQLKQRRRVLVHPIKVQELGHQKVLEIISKVNCEEIKLHFVRPQNKPEEWQGILLMHFGSTKAARQATENLKSVRSDLNVRSNEETAYANRTMDVWVKEEKGQKRWTDTLLWVKNIPKDATEGELFEAFPDSEDIVMHNRSGKKKTESQDTKEAFVVYQNAEDAKNAAKNYEAKTPEINGSQLKVLKYHVPQEIVPKGLLKLKERRLVLKYMEKLTAMKEQLESMEKTVPDWCIQRLEKCQTMVDRDNRVRRTAGLPSPSLEEMKTLKGIKVIRGKECKLTLQVLGILPFTTPQTKATGNNRKREYGSVNSGEKPKVKSLFDMGNDVGSQQVTQTSRYRSLLGDPPSLFATSSHPLNQQQWSASVINPLNSMSPNKPGISKLLSFNPLLSQSQSVNSLLTQRGSVNVNPSVNQFDFLKQQQNLMNLMKQQSTSGVVRGKTPLLASPVTSEIPNLFLKASNQKVPLLGFDFAEPSNKILRLD